VNGQLQALASVSWARSIGRILGGCDCRCGKDSLLLSRIESLSSSTSLHYSDWAIRVRNIWFQKTRTQIFLTSYFHLQTEVSCYIPGRGQRFFCTPKTSTPAPGRTKILLNDYRGLFPLGQSGRGMKLTIHFNLASRLRMHIATPPLPHIPSCHAHGQFYIIRINI
jgi:hypothetical protein